MVLKLLMLSTIVLSAMTSSSSKAFVLLSGPAEAKLDVSRDLPEIAFVLSDQAPTIKDKDQFLGGKYSDLTDDEFWVALVTEAMSVWNNVPESYVTMTLTNSTSAAVDSEDRVHSIVVDSVNLSASAFASPNIEDHTIIDCDITVGNKSTSAKSLAYTLMHELGHCLGLGHNHSNYDAVMGYSRSSRSLKLGLDDMAGLVYLYPTASVGEIKETWGCATIGKAYNHSSTLFLLTLPLLFAGIFYLKRRRFT